VDGVLPDVGESSKRVGIGCCGNGDDVRQIGVCGIGRVEVVVREIVSCRRDKQNAGLLLCLNRIGQCLRIKSSSPTVVGGDNIDALRLQRSNVIQASDRIRGLPAALGVEELQAMI